LKKTEVFRSAVKTTSAGRQGKLTRLDALDFMFALRDRVADVIFVDPPFGIGKDYGIRSRIETADAESYELYMGDVLAEAIRVLKPGGSLFLYHVPTWALRLGSKVQVDLDMRHWIAIAMKNGFVRGKRLYPAHYALLYFTKGEPARFERPKIHPQTCRHCGQYIRDYGGYRKFIEARGVNLSDFWDDLSPVRHRGKKHRAANQLPVLLTDRVLGIAGRRHGLLVDPFVGSGTSLVSAVRAGMHFVANDLAAANLAICRSRVTEARLARESAR
jgi:site-specific DNA-methyltransferase (adenine-specific)